MGFRCPYCHKDFGIDKLKWEEHCEKEHDGQAKYVLDSLKRRIEEETTDKEKS